LLSGLDTPLIKQIDEKVCFKHFQTGFPGLSHSLKKRKNRVIFLARAESFQFAYRLLKLKLSISQKVFKMKILRIGLTLYCYYWI
jgi:hypothetical protein